MGLVCRFSRGVPVRRGWGQLVHRATECLSQRGEEKPSAAPWETGCAAGWAHFSQAPSPQCLTGPLDEQSVGAGGGGGGGSGHLTLGGGGRQAGGPCLGCC